VGSVCCSADGALGTFFSQYERCAFSEENLNNHGRQIRKKKPPISRKPMSLAGRKRPSPSMPKTSCTISELQYRFHLHRKYPPIWVFDCRVPVFVGEQSRLAPIRFTAEEFSRFPPSGVVPRRTRESLRAMGPAPERKRIPRILEATIGKDQTLMDVGEKFRARSRLRRVRPPGSWSSTNHSIAPARKRTFGQ